MERFRLTEIPIPDATLLPPESAAGAVSTFVGIVRDHNEGRPVHRLEYEAYPELAQKEGDRIVAEALGRFPILDAVCVHRTGALAIGETAIRAEAAGAHRAEAIRACEWIVEEVKRRVPIWKKEHYADASGSSEWVNATTPGAPVIAPEAYYARQSRLPEVDPSRLARARVLVVGAGGLGGPALQYLAGAGVGCLTIVDPDRVELSNLHRQPLYGVDDLGIAKATAAARRLRAINPMIEVVPVEARLDATNAEAFVRDHDLVLDGTDRLETKFLLNATCVGVGVPLVVASVHRFEGQLQTVRPEGPCLRCLWPEPPADGCVGTCAEVGVLGVTPGLLGTVQATEALKHLLGLPTAPGVTLVDLLGLSTTRIALPRRPDCPVCGAGATPLVDLAPDPLEIATWDDDAYLAIDVREADEVDRRPSGLRHIPTSAWITPEGDRPLLLVCASGVRSLRLARELDAAGIPAFSLIGGVASLPPSSDAPRP